MPKPTRIEKCRALHFGSNNLCDERLAYRAISAPAELLNCLLLSGHDNQAPPTLAAFLAASRRPTFLLLHAVVWNYGSANYRTLIGSHTLPVKDSHRHGAAPADVRK